MSKIQILDIYLTKKIDSCNDLILTQEVKEIFGGCTCIIDKNGNSVCYK